MHEIQVRAFIYFICKNVSNLCDCNFYDFGTLANIAENGSKQKKLDIGWYRFLYSTTFTCDMSTGSPDSAAWIIGSNP